MSFKLPHQVAEGLPGLGEVSFIQTTEQYVYRALAHSGQRRDIVPVRQQLFLVLTWGMDGGIVSVSMQLTVLLMQ